MPFGKLTEPVASDAISGFRYSIAPRFCCSRPRPPVENCTIMPGQCLRTPSWTRPYNSGSDPGDSSGLRTWICTKDAPASNASCVDSTCSSGVTGTPGLSFLRGTAPVMATVMITGCVMLPFLLYEQTYRFLAASHRYRRATRSRQFRPPRVALRAETCGPSSTSCEEQGHALRPQRTSAPVNRAPARPGTPSPQDIRRRQCRHRLRESLQAPFRAPTSAQWFYRYDAVADLTPAIVLPVRVLDLKAAACRSPCSATARATQRPCGVSLRPRSRRDRDKRRRYRRAL